LRLRWYNVESCFCGIPETLFKDQSLFKRSTVVASVTSVCADNLPFRNNIYRK